MSEVVKVMEDWWHQALTTLTDLSARAPGTVLTQTLVVGALTGWVTYRLMKKRYRLPPGPFAWPLIGNLLWMNSKEEQFFATLARWSREKYGPVISIYIGPMLCVMLNDLDSITDALTHKGADYAGRPHLHSVEMLTEGSRDIAFTDYSPAWKLHRKIALKAIRHYMTGPHLEKIVHEVMAKVADKMAAEPGPFDPHPHTANLLFHIMNCICFGEVRPIDDPTLLHMVDLFDKRNSEIGNGFFEDIFPLLKYCPTRRFRRVMSYFQEFFDYLEEHIQKHRENFSPGETRDVTDSILMAQREVAQEESSEVMAMFTDVHVRQTLSDLFGAGVDTSRFTLSWALLYVGGHPEIQKRAQAEIDAVTGTELPGIGHRSQLPYTQAVLQEAMRLGIVVPMALPHKTTCDTTVGGYQVPKDTMVMANLWAVTHDPNLWEEPDQFKPERFLDNQGQLKPLPKAWLPFSVGRRACLGESVAKPELLLLLACFLKRFTISLPEGMPLHPSENVSMVANDPKPFKIVVTPR
ncbi:hypothetical protein ACOMHN_040972 [Nucella lapillus]